mgnify:CR=1 FL=1|tara:strand:- start:1787 stop:2005 length:219 start_codon:yes stop_codon:yes gene_type:complete
MNQHSLGLDYLAPNGTVGIIIIFIGIVFTAMILYIIYAVSTNKESIEDKRYRISKESEQKKKINRLFPKNKI